MIFLPDKAEWLVDYKRELLTFPNAAHDDQVAEVLAELRGA